MPTRETRGTKLDTQQVEILGRAALTAALVADGLEVAHPERDAGIDLLAFTVKPWAVVPIQMKAATTRVFSINEKYKHIPDLLMVYVWNARVASDAEFFALKWSEAVAVATLLGWTNTASWREKGRYDNTQPGVDVRGKLEQFRMGAGRWHEVIAADVNRQRPDRARPARVR